MTTEITLGLVIESLAIIVPSTITVLTLLKKKFYKETLDNIETKINVMTEQNSANMKHIQKELIIHNRAICSYMETKQAGQKIRQISKHALQVCKNLNTRKILVKFTEEFTVFVRQVLDIGFDSIGQEQLLAKLQLARDNTNFYAESIISEKSLTIWTAELTPHITTYKKDIIEIFSDKVNNKNNRFLIKSLDLAHTFVKEFIIHSSAYEGVI